MSYIVFARKYRPQNFSQLKGQEVLVQTLTNAFLNDKIHHAYLLTGIRGIGKTTTARIIAKTLNCSSLENGDGVLIPCEECTNCLSIKNGSHPDILEFDAASHTGIDDIKSMLEGVSYSPAIGKYRVFIVDEIHMLSTKAFNSLLKTLEEPPSNVVFIFATTELHKVPVTILSRCQKFSLVPLLIDEMSKHIQYISEVESLKISSDAVKLIASKSGGSVRDALSILDQSSMRANNCEITTNLLQDMLGIVSQEDIQKLYKSILSGNSLMVVEHLQEIVSQGVTEVFVLEEMLECIYAEIHRKVKNSEAYSSLLRIWNILLPAMQELSYAFNKRAALEVIFLKAMHIYAMPSVENLVHSISENKIAEILSQFPEAEVEKA